MTFFSLSEVLAYARQNSPFYSKLWANVPTDEERLEQYPIVNQPDFWLANGIDNNSVLTSPLEDGIVFKSGGTTGQPKFSVYSRDEWQSFTKIFGEGMNHAAVFSGDRVANLFYAGDLYSSFLFIHGSLERGQKSSVNFPLSGSIPLNNLIKIVNDFSINVLAGAPTTILGFAEEFERQKILLISVKKIIFGGECLYADQREYLGQIFPGVKIVSLGYASVDGGLLGYADGTCGPDEHRCFDQGTVMEIVDEITGEVIHDVNVRGRLLSTNLMRMLMPIIRYPVGDCAMWREKSGSPNRKFILCGRSEEAARIGPASFYYEDMLHLLSSFKDVKIHGFQLVVTRENGKDKLALVLGGVAPVVKTTHSILESIYQSRPMLKEVVDSGKVSPVTIEWVRPQDLQTNTRTGKLRRIIDLRLS